MLVEQTLYGSIHRSLLNTYYHVSCFDNLNQLIIHEDDIALCLLDANYNIIEKEVLLHHKVNNIDKEFIKDFMRFKKLASHPLIKQHANEIIENLDPYVKRYFMDNEKPHLFFDWKLKFIIKPVNQ